MQPGHHERHRERSVEHGDVPSHHRFATGSARVRTVVGVCDEMNRRRSARMSGRERGRWADHPQADLAKIVRSERLRQERVGA